MQLKVTLLKQKQKLQQQKYLIRLIKAYLFQNYRQLQFVKLMSEWKRLPVNFSSYQKVFLKPTPLYNA